MDSLRTNITSRSSSSHASSPSPLGPTNDDIEAVIQMATSARPSIDGRPGPLRDTRTQLFVGNLPYRVRWQDLKDLFRKAGTVLRADVSLGPDNRSRGYGTVLLATAEDAGRAVDMFNGYSWQTRILEVRPDRLPPDFDNPLGGTNPTSVSGLLGSVPGPVTSTFSAAAHSATSSLSVSNTSDEIDYATLLGLDLPGSSSTGCRNLFVGNLPFHCQWQDLKDLFRQAGTILRADVALGPDGRSRGFGTVSFATDFDAERALQLFNGYEYNGRQLKVHYDKYLQSSQPLTTPASPLLNHALQSGPSVNSNSFSRSMSARPTNITLPAGYQFDFGPASPTSPYDMYHSQLQASMQQQHQQQQQQQQLRHYRNSSSNDMDNLSSRLTLSHISNNTTSSLTQKPSQTASSTSGNHTTANVSTSRNLDQSASASAHQHPHHPGPISLPPPPQATSFPTMSPNLSPHGLGMGASLSPHHYNMTPLQQPSQQQSQIITPHGLPPITPSMPPFTFLPPPQMPPTPTHNGPNSHFAFSQSQSFSPMHPLPSPGAPSSHPPSPMHPSHAHHQHVMSTFSPGVAMSPGAFWGRPGGSNPFINPTVGAPVHMHSPGHGGFFYQIPSPGHVGGGGREPAGYFDPVYFPPMTTTTGVGLGASGLANEILRDKKGEEPWGLQETLVGGESEGEKDGEQEDSSPSDIGTSGSVCDPQERGRRRSSSTTTSWHTSDEDSRTWEGRGEKSPGHGDRELMRAMRAGDQRLPHEGTRENSPGPSRTHSMSASRRTLTHRTGSDPIQTTSSVVGDSTAADLSKTLGGVSSSDSRSASPWQSTLDPVLKYRGESK